MAAPRTAQTNQAAQLSQDPRPDARLLAHHARFRKGDRWLAPVQGCTQEYPRAGHDSSETLAGEIKGGCYNQCVTGITGRSEHD